MLTQTRLLESYPAKPSSPLFSFCALIHPSVISPPPPTFERCLLQGEVPDNKKTKQKKPVNQLSCMKPNTRSQN